MEQLEVREVRYFLAVADSLHFGRAAARLRIAQPALSKTIQRMEARLGVELFVRSSRSVALTPAGQALQEHGQHVLNAVDTAVREARSGAEPDRLRLVMKPGGDAGLLSGLLAAYAEQPEAKRVEILFAGGSDRNRLLRDRDADVGLLYDPFDDLTGLITRKLLVEDRVAVLPETHRLANRETIRSTDLADETFPQWIGVPADEATGPKIADVAELIPLVQIGQAVAVLPRSLVTSAPPGIVCIPVEDARPSSIVLAWSAADQRPSITAFVAAAVSAYGARSGAPTFGSSRSHPESPNRGFSTPSAPTTPQPAPDAHKPLSK